MTYLLEAGVMPVGFIFVMYALLCVINSLGMVKKELFQTVLKTILKTEVFWRKKDSILIPFICTLYNGINMPLPNM